MPKRLKMSTPDEVRKALARVANMVLNNDLDPKAANAIIFAANSMLSAIRADEQERKLFELEQLVKEMERKNG